jgi:hypothetical protein
VPGLFANHGILLNAGYQWQGNTDELRYNSYTMLRFPRGYSSFGALDLMTASLDYTLPLWYPDINVSWLAYFKRVRMTLFGDYARLSVATSRTVNMATNSVRTLSTQFFGLASAGAELTVDLHLLRFGLPISAGFRYAQQLRKSPVRDDMLPFSFLLNITI